MPIINEPSPVPEQTEVHPSKRLKTARQAWESEETTDEDILDQFLKVKQFASNRISSYESEWEHCFLSFSMTFILGA